MANPSQVILLVEDGNHQQFLYKYLRRLGRRPHDLRIVKSPFALGSAEQWIQNQFATEFKAYRRRPAKTQLIVMIDADMHTVQHRLQQLDKALLEADIALNPNDMESVARLVPKRNIETWILCENEIPVDEVTDYKRTRDNWTELIGSGVVALYAWTRLNAVVPSWCVGSLQLGIQELRKLDAN